MTTVKAQRLRIYDYTIAEPKNIRSPQVVDLYSVESYLKTLWRAIHSAEARGQRRENGNTTTTTNREHFNLSAGSYGPEPDDPQQRQASD